MTTKRKIILALIGGFVLGIIWFVAFRFAVYKDNRVHYHGNFALYINGQRDDFKSSTYYEETQACSADEVGPKARVHMHDQVDHVVHVHEEGATWGHLFANFGYGINGKSVQTDDGVYVDGENSNQLTYILNGKPISNAANEVIRSEDVLLINYGNDSEETLNQRYEDIKKDAGEYNSKSDPSSCSGSKPLTFTERLKKAIGLSH